MVSNDDPAANSQSLSEAFPGLIADPGWTTLAKPQKLLDLFERSFAGNFRGINVSKLPSLESSGSQWEPYARIAFQDDPGFSGDCETTIVDGSLLFGMSCRSVGENAAEFCRLNSSSSSGGGSNLGSWFSAYPMPNTTSDQVCRSLAVPENQNLVFEGRDCVDVGEEGDFEFCKADGARGA